MPAIPPEYAFRGPGLDRAEDLRDDPTALDRCWRDSRVLVVDGEGQARFPEVTDAVGWLRGTDLGPQRPSAASLLGREGDTVWFALAHESLAQPLAGRIDLRSAAAQWPALEAAALAQARALLHWQERSRHCGRCGEETELQRAGYLARCPRCGSENHPRTDPAIIVAVSDGPRLLLGRQAGWPPGRWSVLAGFVEPGESLEQAVAREVMEEAGIIVLESRYAASQPWPFPGSIMLGFHAEALPADPCVGAELDAARWFSAAELRAGHVDGSIALSPRLSIARWLIDDWLARAESVGGR